jgi:Ca-activated chloride channel family protein
LNKIKNIALVLFLFSFFQANSQEKLTRILFVLDASNSMNADWGNGQTRIEAAKDVLIKCVDSLVGTANLEIALRVYGHQSPITATYQDCNDTKLEVPFAQDNYRNVRNKLKTIMAKGTTPIARSLEASAGDFPDNQSTNIIILITDGIEACDNDPCVIAKKLKDKSINVTPFVIGLGLDLSYLEKFKCIGAYSEAETIDAFKNVLKTIVNKSISNTTVQININDSSKNPKETDVTMFLYEAGTNKLKYTYTHTINRYGNPDTLVIDPNFKYDLVINTLPKIEKKNITILKNTHNTINVDGPQGYLKVRTNNGNKDYAIVTRVMLHGSTQTINLQDLNFVDKYIIGKYDLEIMTLPRIYQTITVDQNSTTNVDILAPGLLSYKSANNIVAQLFMLNSEGKWDWIHNLDLTKNYDNVFMQPGSYRMVYRQKNLRSSANTFEKDFKIYSNKTTTINL